MKNISTIIIDDEQDSRALVRIYLQEHFPNIQIVGEAHSVKSGIDVLNATDTDLLFLDVRMKDGRGFDILRQLSSPNFDVIFITAHDEYAIEAIKHHAMDYLLKPLDRDEFKLAVQRFLDQNNRQPPNRIQELLNYIREGSAPEQIKLPTLSGFVLVKPQNIVYLQADNNYTHVHTSDGKSLLVSKNLKEYESMLSSAQFCRIHHSYIVNVKYVIEYIKGRGGQVVLKGGVALPVSQARKNSLLEYWS